MFLLMSSLDFAFYKMEIEREGYVCKNHDVQEKKCRCNDRYGVRCAVITGRYKASGQFNLDFV